MSRVGIFGGTFDPIHNGHLITAQSVREIRGLDKIIFIPSFISPHKKELIPSSPKYRLDMIKLAIKDIEFFDYSDIEIKKTGISYSVDTLEELKKEYDELEFIIGYDNIFTFKNVLNTLVTNINFEKPGFWINIFFKSCGQVICYNYVMSLSNKSISNLGSNKPGTAGNENFHLIICTIFF